MKASVSFSYNVELDATTATFSKSFEKLNFVQQLDFLHDIYTRISLEYDKKLKKSIKQAKK